MGMTDRQFDVHLQGLVRDLKRIQKQLASTGAKNDELDELIKDYEAQLKRP